MALFENDKKNLTAPQLADILNATNDWNRAVKSGNYGGMARAAAKAKAVRAEAGYKVDDAGNATANEIKQEKTALKDAVADSGTAKQQKILQSVENLKKSARNAKVDALKDVAANRLAAQQEQDNRISEIKESRIAPPMPVRYGIANPTKQTFEIPSESIDSGTALAYNGDDRAIPKQKQQLEPIEPLISGADNDTKWPVNGTIPDLTGNPDTPRIYQESRKKAYLQLQQEQETGEYPPWAQRKLYDLKVLWLMAETSGNQADMAYLAMQGAEVRRQIDEIRKMPPQLADVLQRIKLGYMEAEGKNDALQKAKYAELGQGFWQKWEEIKSLPYQVQQERMAQETVNWYRASGLTGEAVNEQGMAEEHTSANAIRNKDSVIVKMVDPNTNSEGRFPIHDDILENDVDGYKEKGWVKGSQGGYTVINPSNGYTIYGNIAARDVQGYLDKGYLLPGTDVKLLDPQNRYMEQIILAEDVAGWLEKGFVLPGEVVTMYDPKDNYKAHAILAQHVGTQLKSGLTLSTAKNRGADATLHSRSGTVNRSSSQKSTALYWLQSILSAQEKKETGWLTNQSDADSTIKYSIEQIKLTDEYRNDAEFKKVFDQYCRKFKGSGQDIEALISIAEKAGKRVAGAKNANLGILSAKYESNGNSGSIANNLGDPGGKSYGAYQLSSKRGSVDNFLNWLKNKNSNYHHQLISAKGLDDNSFGSNFDIVWKQIATNDRARFLQLQHEYIKFSYCDVAAKDLKERYGFDINTRSVALQNVLWSTAVQHGSAGAVSIFSKVNFYRTDEEIINQIYNERSKVDIYFKNSSTSIKNSVLNRFKNERIDALNMLYGI